MNRKASRIIFEKRDKLPWYWNILTPVVCVVLAMALCGVIMELSGFNAFKAYAKLFVGAFGSKVAISESILQAIPLLLCGLGVTVSFKMSLNNIGGEGQFLMGAFAATGVALFCPWIPSNLTLPVMVLAGFLAGAIWAMLGVAPKVLWGVNETIITLMLNYIALLWIQFLVYGPWRDQTALNMPFSPVFPGYALFAKLSGTRVHTGIFLGLAAAVLIFLYFRGTTGGYRIRVAGASVRAARYAGMNISRSMFLVMLFAGGIAGVGGVTMAAGAAERLMSNIANGAGYVGITIAYMSKFNPLVVVLVSLLFGGLAQGGLNLQLVGVPTQLSSMLQGSILFFVLGGEIFLRNRIRLVRASCEQSKGGTAA
ncbi:MAG: ABC transporter permease [Bacillota bacterium]